MIPLSQAARDLNSGLTDAPADVDQRNKDRYGTPKNDPNFHLSALRYRTIRQRQQPNLIQFPHPLECAPLQAMYTGSSSMMLDA